MSVEGASKTRGGTRGGTYLGQPAALMRGEEAGNTRAGEQKKGQGELERRKRRLESVAQGGDVLKGAGVDKVHPYEDEADVQEYVKPGQHAHDQQEPVADVEPETGPRKAEPVFQLPPHELGRGPEK